MRSQIEVDNEVKALEALKGVDEIAKESMRYALRWADGTYHIPPRQNLKDCRSS